MVVSLMLARLFTETSLPLRSAGCRIGESSGTTTAWKPPVSDALVALATYWTGRPLSWATIPET